jgi:phytoene dehydrogenase-like protein
MAPHPRGEALVVGGGPNGLAAAIALARAGVHVELRERASAVGGGVASAELTLPGYIHDVCASVFALAAASPFFRSLPLTANGVAWCHPEAPLAHPFDDGSAVVLHRSLDETVTELGTDGRAYRRLVAPLADRWDAFAADALQPLLRVPSSPLLMARFGLAGVRPAANLSNAAFTTERARALFIGLAAHAAWPLERPMTSAFGLVLAAAAHVVGWPFAAGGAGRLAAALDAVARDAGVTIRVNTPVTSLAERPPAQAVLCDVHPSHLLSLSGDILPPGYRRALQRFVPGPGAFKIDWALRGPIPWKAAACRRAGTVHLGGTSAEIVAAEREVGEGRHPERPFVLLTQPSICDPSRAPNGGHTAWAYCHVPNGSTEDMTTQIGRQVERFAPGFQDLVLARHTMDPGALHAHNPNLVGGDFSGGAATVRQLFARPTWRAYGTPVPWLFLCSAATPPGGGVHGMCGYHAAQAALRVFGAP